MSEITIEERLFRGVTIIDLSGKLGLGESNRRLHESIRRLVLEGKTQIIVNLEKVTHIDSSGLGELVSGYTTLKANNGELKLTNVNERITDLMTITKLYTVFEIFSTELDAVYSFDDPTPAVITGPLNTPFDPVVLANSTIQ
jgi:anti-sigma B factor antagonist